MKISRTCRVANLDDIPVVIPLLKEFFDQSSFKDFQFDEAKVRLLCETAVVDPKRYIIILSMDKEEVVGLIAGKLDVAAFSSDIAAIEMAWYVKPEYRKGKRAFELLDSFDAWAEAAGAAYVYYGMLKDPVAPEHETKLDRLYKHRGFRPAEAGYIRKCKRR
jgi:GNAT superfamily N-acetyltransferase